MNDYQDVSESMNWILWICNSLHALQSYDGILFTSCLGIIFLSCYRADMVHFQGDL